MTREEAVWYVNHTFEVTKEELCNNGRFDEATEFEIAQNMAIEALQEPEIVRCKDCNKTFRHEGDIICNHCSGALGFNLLVKDDDYCSCGEKKQVTGKQKSVETSTEKADGSTKKQVRRETSILSRNFNYPRSHRKS